MDIQMTDMDGNEDTRQIRKFNPDLKNIVQTAFALTGDREKAVETGCKEFIEKHGSRIWVESEKGKGSTFYFTISCREEQIM